MNQKNFIIVQGIARNVTWRERHDGSSQYGSVYQILSFTVEVTDENGNIQRYVPVYLESHQIQGVLYGGEKVIVSGSIDRNGTLIPEVIENKQTDAKIAFQATSDLSDPLVWLQGTIILGAFIMVFCLGLWFIAETGFLGGVIILVVLSVIYFAYSAYRRSRE